MNDELREQLGRLDPMHPGVPVESATTPSSQARMEKIMNTPLIEENPGPSGQMQRPPDQRQATKNRRRQGMRVVAGLAAAAVVAVGGAAIIGNIGDDEPDVTAPPLELSLGEGDAMASCMPFDVAILSTMSPALAATATQVGDGTVTLAVDRWYTGGDAATVVLSTPNSSPALIAGFEFEVGQQYLITGAQGNVNFCGYSGPATPDLTAAFDAAFPG